MQQSKSFLYSILMVQTFSLSLCESSTAKPADSKNDWDFLIFTQRWPVTACAEWEGLGKNNSCAFPQPTDLWTIHGIWPTKLGTKGPSNCNSTWHFNATQLAPIEMELKEYWTNVENNTQLTSLWRHEWTKHGTCAAILPILNNEFKYFNQGLLWLQQYNMKFILSQNNISPNNEGYSIEDIFNTTQSVLGKVPMIQCIVDRKTKQSLISEIRICFDKELNLIDCATQEYVEGANILTNCNLKKIVMYPDSVGPYTTSPSPISTTSTAGTTETTTEVLFTAVDTTLDSLFKTEQQLLTVYRTIKFLIWATI